MCQQIDFWILLYNELAYFDSLGDVSAVLACRCSRHVSGLVLMVCDERGGEVNFFSSGLHSYIKNKLKSEIFNDEKSL